MAYTKHKPLQTLIAIACIGGIAGLFFTISGKYDQEVIREFEAPASSLIISPEKPLLIPLPHSEKQIAGVVVYAGDEASAHISLRASIQDIHGNILSKKQRQITRYKKSGAPEIQIFFQRKTYGEKEKVFLSLAPLRSESVTLVANEGLVLSTLYREPVSAGTKQGVVIGTAFALSLILIYQLRNTKRVWLFAGASIFLFSILVTLPYIYRPSAWGIHDWDYRHSLSHIYQTTIQNYHEFPFWNPYICGGTAGLGDPEFALFTPSFVLQSIFGVENGTGIALSLGLIITGIGMLVLGRSMKLDPFSALMSASVVMFGSSLLLKASEGHTTIIFAYMWVPWVFWAWLYAYRTTKTIWTLLCGIFLAFALLQGGIYILSYTILSFIGVSLLSSRKKDAMRISLYAVLWMIGLAAFQLIPTLFFLREFPDPTFVGSTYTYTRLWDIFFGRYLPNTHVLQNQVSRWHEYGAYIGYGVFALVLLGMSYWKHSRIVRTLVIGTGVTLVISSLGPLFQPVLEHVPFIPRSNISRLVLFTLLCGSLLAGFGMKRILNTFSPRYTLIPLCIAGFIAIDLLSLAYPIAEQGFAIPPFTENIEKSPYPIEHVTKTYEVRHQGVDMPRGYAAILQGYGTSSFCSVIGPESRVIRDVTGYLLAEEGVTTSLVSWSPNKIVFSYDAPHNTDIIVNSNYANGWHASNGLILRTNKILTIRVPAGKDTVTLHYSPPGLLLGITISICTFIVCIGRGFFLRRSSR